MNLENSYWIKNDDTECLIVGTNITGGCTNYVREIHVLAIESGKVMFRFPVSDCERHPIMVKRVQVSNDGRFLISSTGSPEGGNKIQIFVFADF